jgi:hypothetical protein
VYLEEAEHMAIIHKSFPGYSSASPLNVDVEAIAQSGVHAVFRARAFAKQQHILAQMERRERVVLILLDGQRTLHDVARLTHHIDLEVAHILAHLLARGYIEFIGTNDTPDR